MNCDALTAEMSTLDLVIACDKIRNEMLRIATPFQYPDTSNIDVFLREEDSSYLLTDLGNTLSNLLNVHVKPSTKKRKKIIADVCDSLGVEYKNGDLYIEVPKNELPKMSLAIARLAQACIRVSDLCFSRRFSNVSEFNEDVEEFIDELSVPYRPGEKVLGAHGEVPLDFIVEGPKSESYILTMSSANAATSHTIANEIFVKWSDCRTLKRPNRHFVSIYDSSNNVFKREDLERLIEVSTVVAYPEQKQLVSSLLVA